MPFEEPVVVIDNGSYNIKAGFSCDNHPVSMFRNLVGRPSYLNKGYGREYYDVCVGDNAVIHDGDLDLSSPVNNGQIVNWDNMERIWHHVFYRELKVAPEDRAVMLACSPTTPISEKIKFCEVFFETLNSPALCIQSQCVLALYGSGVTTGICVDIGHDNTNINPVYEGGSINYAKMQTQFAGHHISDFIKKSLQERNIDFGINTEEIVEEIKINCLYITSDSAMTLKDCCRKFKLPDGKEINVGQEAFMAAEIIFQPELVLGEGSYLSLHKAVTTSALKCDPDLRPNLYQAVILCGGPSLIPGFGQRLTAEIKNMTQCPVSLLFSSEAYAMAWLGGTVFASLPDSKQMWITKSMYNDYGEKIIRNKFS